VLHRLDDRPNPISWSRHLASSIKDAEFVELNGIDWWPFLGDANGLLDELERFVVGSPVGLGETRALGTVVFTDIVGSTERAAALGDEAWKGLLAQHDVCAKREIARFDGRYVKSTGDGLLAVFDGPARATHCAMAIVAGVQDLGLEIRAGVHTGEVENVGGDIQGLSVHIGARVSDRAAPSEVLVSQTVKDLVAGSGLRFEDAGEHELKGVPDRWHLYRVVGA
jgi:class 3 adenylate cyclase